ncbi:MAG: DNA methyltransferase, partial [Bdellovibrionaceae bacterium]|nr:DNA methyltransferase [Pseudobdellovibrionaceae bacterium]
ADCLYYLNKIPNHIKFDLIIADPPYNIGKNFGNNSDNKSLYEYVEWSNFWIKKCLNLLKEDGLIYIYGFPEILAHVSINFPLENQKWLVWHYTNKTVPSLKFWQRSHETILCLWANKRPKIEINRIREPYTESYKKCIGRKRKNTKGRFGVKETIYNGHKNGALPRDVIKIPSLAGGKGSVERYFLCHTCNSKLFPPSQIEQHRTHKILKHPTQKPMSLTKKLILSRIKNKKGNLLIPFAGSGSECVLAKFMRINYLGIEINPEYAFFAKSWLERGLDEELTKRI